MLHAFACSRVFLPRKGRLSAKDLIKYRGKAVYVCAGTNQIETTGCLLAPWRATRSVPRVSQLDSWKTTLPVHHHPTVRLVAANLFGQTPIDHDDFAEVADDYVVAL